MDDLSKCIAGQDIAIMSRLHPLQHQQVGFWDLIAEHSAVSVLQAQLLQVVESLATKQDTIASRLDKLTDQLHQLLTKQASTTLL